MPEKDLVKVEDQVAGNVKPDSQAIERIVMAGDYGALTVKQRVTYVEMLCEKLGLSWHTQPFIWVVLNGKLTLYATKNATDQLRSSRGISVSIVDRTKMEGDVYLVRALATMPDGRTDESLGAIGIAGLSGDLLANALMKAETKAKRRVTMSICGLSFMDETEVQSVQGLQKPQAEGVRRIAPVPSAYTVSTATVLPGQEKLPLEGKVELTEAILVDAISTKELPKVEPEPARPTKFPPASAPIRAKI